MIEEAWEANKTARMSRFHVNETAAAEIVSGNADAADAADAFAVAGESLAPNATISNITTAEQLELLAELVAA